MSDTHYSAFALDVYFASTAPRDPIIEAHVRDCAECSGYLAELESLRFVPPPKKATPRRYVWLATGMAITAAAALFVVSNRSVPADYVGEKGSPSVQVLVREGGSTHVWDGRAPVNSGDALALRVSCEGLSRVVVQGGAAPLYAGACPPESAVLPFTLIPDSEPGDERLDVVMSRRVLEPSALQDAIASGTRSAEIWVVRFSFAKRTTR